MPNLNAAAYIRQAIESVLSQGYGNFELLVVDNGSEDVSVSVIEDFARKDSRVRLFKESRRGTSNARNTGIRLAKGEFVTMLDSDDICSSDRLSKQVKRMQEIDASACYTEGWLIDDKGLPTGQLYNRDVVKLPTEYEGSIFHELIRYDFIIGGSVMISRKCFESDRFDPMLDFGEDWDFLVRLSRRLDFCYIPEPLYGYRIHSGNTWAKGNEEKVLRNRILTCEKWLRRFGDLSKQDRDLILRRLLESRADQSGHIGLIRVALTHPSASTMLLQRARSSLARRMGEKK